MLPTLETPEPNFHLLNNVLNINDKFKPNPLVLVRLARAFYEKGSLKKSHLHLVSRTTWPSLKKYLKWLEENNHLKYYENDEHYKPTENGWTMFRLISLFYDHIDLKKGKPLLLL